jgi:hypothetical protein
MTNEEVVGDYKSFISDILKRAADLKIDAGNFSIDHLCYRVASLADYEEMKQKLMAVSSAYVENLHNNRPIAKFLLKTPLTFEKHAVPLIELPAPKAGTAYSSGLEHLEMAVGDGFDEFVPQYQNLWTGKSDKGVGNPTVYIVFDNGKTIKFHKNSLSDVLRSEGQSFMQIDTVARRE